MKYKYFVEDYGETVDDAILVYRERFDRELNDFVKDYQFSGDHYDVAEYAARLHYQRSSPDWNDGSQKISIVDQLGNIESFDVLLEYEPTFNVSKCK